MAIVYRMRLRCVQVTQAQLPVISYPYAGAGGTFSINPITGLLSWCVPQYAGDYNVVIKITEWRKDDDGFYYMVGYVERDTELKYWNMQQGINETGYSYLVLTEYTDGATSYASNISSIQAVVGLNELSLNTNIQISPNPVTENLTLSLNQNSGELFDIDIH